MSRILRNAIQTPDGTILESFSRWDYKTHIDSKTGEEYMVDGGLDYSRSNINKVRAKSLMITTDSPFEEIREGFKWGTRGKEGDQPLKYVPLKDLSSEHIEAILETQHHIHSDIRNIFQKELDYRAS